MHKTTLKTAGIFLVLAIALPACHYVDINYIGKSYPPTQDVQMFFSRTDIPKDYRVIGRAIVTAPEGTKGAKVEEGLLKEAKQKGADGVLVGQARQYLKSTTTDWGWNYYGGPGWAWGDPYGWAYGGPEWAGCGPVVPFGVDYASNPETIYNYAFKMKVIFLKKEGEK